MNLVRWRKKVESAHILCICAYVGFVSAWLFRDLRFCPVVSMWRNAWDAVALMCLAAIIVAYLSVWAPVALLHVFSLAVTSSVSLCQLYTPPTPSSHILTDPRPMNICMTQLFIVSLYLYVCCYVTTSRVFTRPVLVCVSCCNSDTPRQSRQHGKQ